MEGVGARLGRSSTRYGGPATVFTGPVRKWKKKWVHVTPSNGISSSDQYRNSAINGNVNGTHLKVYKWTPIQRNDNNSDSGKSDDLTPETEEPPRRKFKYVPIALLEEQKEAAEQVEDEDKPSETDVVATDLNSKPDCINEKPDMNDVPMEENQEPSNPLGRQDLNKSTLDTGINLNAHDGENDSDSETDQIKDTEDMK